MKIAIIDDGICSKEIHSLIEVHLIGRFHNTEFKQKKLDSHGTICAKIIEKYSSPDKIIDIPILDEDERASVSDMCTALEYCLDVKVDIVNLSCGSSFYCRSTSEYIRLKNICKKMYFQGIKIFAAQNNSGELTVPAELPYVKSVEQYIRGGIGSRILFRRSDIYTESSHWIKINHRITKTQKCNSYACAYASACEIEKKHNILKKYINSDTVNATLTSYISREISEGVFDLYLDDDVKPVARLYFDEPNKSEKRYIKTNRIRSMVLNDSLEQCRFIKECSRFYKNTEIPIVFIQNNEKAMDVANWLDNNFNANYYKSSVISSNKRDVLSGAIFSPDSCIEDFSKLFSNYNDCNVLILICNEFNIENTDDVYIKIDSDNYMLSFNKKNKTLGSVNELFNEIIKCFDIEIERENE